jgi:hypothetical protein
MISRATKGNETKTVASTMPGTANTTRMPWSRNQAPNQHSVFRFGQAVPAEFGKDPPFAEQSGLEELSLERLAPAHSGRFRDGAGQFRATDQPLLFGLIQVEQEGLDTPLVATCTDTTTGTPFLSVSARFTV